MKKHFIWMLVLLIVATSAYAQLDLEILNTNMESKKIFSPGSEIIFKVDAPQDVETVTLIIIKDNDIFATKRMKVLLEEPKQFAYLYQISTNEKQGDYKAKVISKGMVDEKEFYVGIELKGELLGSKDVEEIRASQLSWWQKVVEFLREVFRLEK